MRLRWLFAALLPVLIIGCSGKEDELQKQLSQVQSEKTSLQQTLTDRDSYIDQVMKAVNDVYADLEQARVKEGKLKERASGTEGPSVIASADTKQKLLQDIGDIGTTLKANRKKIADLNVMIKKYDGKIAGLSTMVDNLNKSIQEREESIAQLEAKVRGLEATVAENTKTIAQKESVIDEQQKKMNTVYYVVGTKDDLRKKGIITDEGGFLWGLLGSTTIMNSGADPSYFTPLDRSRDKTINVDGKIDEILPRRSPDLFSTDDTGSKLTITSPEKFWQANYLVIITD